jgi:hypothetical protein
MSMCGRIAGQLTPESAAAESRGGNGRTNPHAHYAAQCGLGAVLRLERSPHVHVSSAEILSTLLRITEWCNPTSCLPSLSTLETLGDAMATQVYR